MRVFTSILPAALLVLCSSAPAKGTESLSLHEASRPDSDALADNIVGASVHSNAWFSIEAHYLRRVRLSWLNKTILVGASLDFPLLLWIQTKELDTIRVSFRGAVEMMRYHWFALAMDLQTRLGVQDSVLNTSLGWDFQLTVAPTLSYSRWTLSTFFGLRQGLATYLNHGGVVDDAFGERYPDGTVGTGGPQNGWIAGGNTRIPMGLSFGVDLPHQVSLHGSAGLVWTHSALGVGLFDAMMLGRWPFFVDLGVSWQF